MSGEVTLGGRVLVRGEVVAEAAGVVQRGEVERRGAWLSLDAGTLMAPPCTIADVYWYETTMELYERRRAAGAYGRPPSPDFGVVS